MAIPETQMDTWSHRGSVTQSSTTYQTVRNALNASTAVYADKSFEVLLQGSYGNDTNIYAESDVDVVIRLNSIFGYGIGDLPPEQQAAFHQAHPGSAGYTFAEFKQGVITRLSTAFGAKAVTPGSKAIKVEASASRRSSDVIACYQYRRYTRFVSATDYEYTPGVTFAAAPGAYIINYPKIHAESLTTKHQATNQWFKPMVRIMKNMRSRLVDRDIIASSTAPSYFVEGMLWNVPNDKFGTSYGDTFCNCINWLRQIDKSKLVCANQQFWLFGGGNVQWNLSDCDRFLNATSALWNEW